MRNFSTRPAQELQTGSNFRDNDEINLTYSGWLNFYQINTEIAKEKGTVLLPFHNDSSFGPEMMVTRCKLFLVSITMCPWSTHLLSIPKNKVISGLGFRGSLGLL